jgi:hypothetical protein
MTNVYKILVGIKKRSDYLGDLDADERIILK